MTNIVRESHFRHVFGEENHLETCYTDVKALFAGESSFIKVNPKFFCVAKPGGGGPVYIHKNGEYGRFDLSHPTINVHTAQVLDFDFNPFHDNVIATASDDCTVAVTKFPADGLKENLNKPSSVLNGHTKKLTFVQWHPVADNVVASCAYDRDVKVWDVEASEEVLTMVDHEENIFSMEWSTNGSKLLTTARDCKLRVFDPRDPDGKVLSADIHESPKTSKGFWLDDKGMVASVGFKKSSVREILFFDQKKMDKPVHKIDLDQANSVLTPLYEPANQLLYLAGKGDTGVRFFEITEQEGFCHYLSEYRFSKPAKGVAFMPRRGVETAKAELLKLYRLTRDTVIPSSVLCPRKNAKAVFQEDLYPDCYAGVPTLSIDDYFDGLDAEPKLMSLRPAGSSAGGRRKNRRVRGRGKQNSEGDSSAKAASEPADEPAAEPAPAADRDSVELERRVSELESELDSARSEIEDLKENLKKAEKAAASAGGSAKAAKLNEKKIKRMQKELEQVESLRSQVADLKEELADSEKIISEQAGRIKELSG